MRFDFTKKSKFFGTAPAASSCPAEDMNNCANIIAVTGIALAMSVIFIIDSLALFVIIILSIIINKFKIFQKLKPIVLA